MQYRSNRGYTGGGQLGVLIGLTGAGMVVVSLIQMMVAYWLIPSGTPVEVLDTAMMEALKDPANVGYARLLQAAGTLLLFFIPAVLFSVVTNGRSRIWLGFHRHAGIRQFVLGFAIIFLSNIAASGLEEISRSILARFPSIDKMAHEMENAYNESVKVIGLIRTWPELITALLIMAFLPALFEETYFRGAIQSTMEKWWSSPVLAILVSSLVFSLIHFSIYLFFSRFLLGLALGIMFHLTRNIWVSIVAHFMNNAIAVVQLYIVSRGKKEVEINELSPDYDLWLMIPAFLLIFALIKLLQRNSFVNRESCLEEERNLSGG